MSWRHFAEEAIAAIGLSLVFFSAMILTLMFQAPTP